MPTVNTLTPSFDASSAMASGSLSVSSPSVSSRMICARVGPPFARRRVSRSSDACMAWPMAVPPTGMSHGLRSRQNSFTAA